MTWGSGVTQWIQQLFQVWGYTLNTGRLIYRLTDWLTDRQLKLSRKQMFRVRAGQNDRKQIDGSVLGDTYSDSGTNSGQALSIGRTYVINHLLKCSSSPTLLTASSTLMSFPLISCCWRLNFSRWCTLFVYPPLWVMPIGSCGFQNKLLLLWTEVNVNLCCHVQLHVKTVRGVDLGYF